jgi:hypothetical protein
MPVFFIVCQIYDNYYVKNASLFKTNIWRWRLYFDVPYDNFEIRENPFIWIINWIMEWNTTEIIHVNHLH